MGNFDKQSSKVSCDQAMKALQADGWDVVRYPKGQIPPAPRPTERANVMFARGRFGPDVMTSNKGLTVAFRKAGHHEQVSLRLKGMLGIGELAAIQQKTGLLKAVNR